MSVRERMVRLLRKSGISIMADMSDINWTEKTVCGESEKRLV